MLVVMPAPDGKAYARMQARHARYTGVCQEGGGRRCARLPSCLPCMRGCRGCVRVGGGRHARGARGTGLRRRRAAFAVPACDDACPQAACTRTCTCMWP